MKRNLVSFRSNVRLARQLWGEPSRIALRGLRELTARYCAVSGCGRSAALGGPMVCDPLWTPASLLRGEVAEVLGDPTEPILRSHDESMGLQSHRL